MTRRREETASVPPEPQSGWRHRDPPPPTETDPLENPEEADRPTTFRENLRITLPLFFVGGAALLLTVYLLEVAGTQQSGRLPLWLLSLSIGIVATAGASTALLFGDFSEPPEGIGTGALRSGDYVLVTRREWERMRRSPRPLAPWAESPPDAPQEGWEPSDVGPPHDGEPAVENGSPVPLWEESELDPETVRRVGRANRATDRLAREVDDLVQTLTRLSATNRGIAVVGGLTPAVRPTADAKRQYETLLDQLRNEAERAGGARNGPLLCAGCGRAIDVQNDWEPCNACWRTYCATCGAAARRGNGAFVCPGCGHSG